MNEIILTSSQISAFFMRGLITAALPFVIFLYLHKRHGAKLYPFFVGAAALILISMPRALTRSIATQGSDSFFVKFLIADIIGAAFEECGRYIAMKHAMPNHDRTVDALCYGAGHGGVEALSTAANQFSFWMLCMQYNGVSSAQNPLIAERLQVLAGQSTWIVAEMAVNETAGLVFHMAMSVLIAEAVHYDGCRKYIPIAIGIHALFNVLGLAFGIFANVLVVALCWFVYRRKQN